MIEELIAQDEGKTLEFKEGLQSLSGIVKAVVAFANTAGGIIVVGVQDRTKKIVGVSNVLDEEERLTSVISDSIAPFLIPNIEIQTYRKKELILIHVPHVAGPCYVKAAGQTQGVYVRFGSTNRLADAEMLKALQLYADKTSFDEIPCVRAKINTLDWDFIVDSFKSVGKRITEAKAENLGMLSIRAGDRCPSFGGVILFGLHRLRVFPDAIIRCARFKGINKAAVLDHKEIFSYPVLAIDEAIQFVENNTITGVKFGRIRRTDVTQYPVVAIREIIINAVMHTDYASMGACIQIAIFDDRIEISNPGGLPIGMTMERALGGSSRVRNRVIAKVFRQLQMSEQWGSGFQRIIDACIQEGLAQPVFEDLNTEFKVTLYAEKKRKAAIDKADATFIAYVKAKEKIGTKQAAAFWGIAPRNARERLKKLVDAGVLKRVGTSAKDPLSGYVLTHS